MFDQTKKTDGSSHQNKKPTSLDNSSSLNEIDKNQEPEDIFKQVDSFKGSNQEKNSQVSETVDKKYPVNSEPSIKSPPSVFKKITSSQVDKSSQSEQPEPIADLPSLPHINHNHKKNLIVLVLSILAIVIIAIVIYWFFILTPRKETKPAINNFQSQIKENKIASSTVADKTLPAKITLDENNYSKATSTLDSDQDGLTDEEEALLGTSSQTPDTDKDGLFDRDEVKVYKTDPLKPDTDGDGWSDGEEVRQKSNPLDPTSIPITAKRYKSQFYKFSFVPLPDMFLGSAVDNIVRFNNDKQQVKFYVYINSWPSDIKPDKIYNITEDNSGKLRINSIQSLPDKTPHATDLVTSVLTANNGNRYLIRYVATRRSNEHLDNFKKLLESFIFIH